MKKLFALALALLLTFALVGCDNGKEVNITFPFEVSQITNIEMYHFTVPTSAEKKTVTEKADIEMLHNKFSELSLSTKEVDVATGAETVSFRFNLSDGTAYELIYTGDGVKSGMLTSPTGGFSYFTSADVIGLSWSALDKDYEGVAVEESELPK